MIDLHVHSTASDGTLTPKEIVEQAETVGLTALALTDHDTVQGIDEAARAAEAKPLTFVPGVEISAVIKKGALHIVGLFIDPKAPALLETLAWAAERRVERNAVMIERLARLGMPLTMAELDEAAKGGMVGRPHFATVMVQKGYAKSFRVAFRNWLKKGQAAYCPKKRVDRRRAIEVIREAGGVPILAHPNQTQRLGDELEKLVKELTDDGLGGLETHCSGHSEDDIRLLSRLAEKYHLVESGGSDFHGAIKPGLALGKGPGGLRVPDDFLEPIKRRAVLNLGRHGDPPRRNGLK